MTVNSAVGESKLRAEEVEVEVLCWGGGVCVAVTCVYVCVDACCAARAVPGERGYCETERVLWLKPELPVCPGLSGVTEVREPSGHSGAST